MRIMRHHATVLILLGTLVLDVQASLAQQKVGKPKVANPPSKEIPENITAELDVVYARYGKRELHADLFRQKSVRRPTPTLVVVHGGGWLKGDKNKFRAMAIQLARQGFVTVAIEYRLGGEALFPAAIHDCNAAVRFLRAHAGKYFVDPKRIGAIGGSAGGHLVGLMATASHVDAFQGPGGNPQQSSLIQAAVVLAGPLELATGSVAEKSRKDPENSNANKWFGKTIDEAPELYRQASPFTHVSKETPPILFMAGDLDYPARNQGTRDKLKALGIETGIVVVKDGKHGCWNREPWFSLMIKDMNTFFRRTLK